MNQDHVSGGKPRREQRKSPDRRRNPERRAGLRRRESGGKSMITLAVLAFLSSAILLVFFLFQSGIGDAVDWGELMFRKDRPVEDFQIGGVVLGIKPEALQRDHPKLDLKSLVRGEKIARFNAEKADYTVWFVTINGLEKAYRIRQDRVIFGKTESDLVEDIGRRHGKPGTSECTKSAAGERKCHFQWWPSGGIALNVLSLTKKKDGKPVTAITIIATDTYLDGKRIRNLGQ